ncbi:histidine phosphatase family protein [Nocardia higoensis]|uniref:histidine phosphatase family protein n=1 Tax=Nocardia higoensis TaxID=228599 RepID=UPI000A01B0C1|nr:histidine phosphatase family protein [Nocardia higoensis]
MSRPNAAPVSVVLVRHAQPVIPLIGGPDDHQRPLVEQGWRQAEALVEILSRPRPVVIMSSPYLRAVQTVQPLAQALDMPVHTRHELREWESGLPLTPHSEHFYAQSWADSGHTHSDGESLDQLTTRAKQAVTAAARERRGGVVVIASHGTFISRALVGLGVAQVDWPFSRVMPMPAVYRLEVHGNRLRVEGPGLDDTGHTRCGSYW